MAKSNKPLSRFIRMITFLELLQGLGITFKWFSRRKVTENYPDVRPVLPYRSKGRLHVDIETCISCKMCEKACPEDCIKVFQPPREVFKQDKRPVEFLLSMEHCLHCGLCVDPCPTGSIHHSYEFESAVFDPKDLLYDRETLPYDLDIKHYRWNGLENVVDVRDGR
ncbi:MAG: NADH-quinone oxidoreductase subunit I [Acidobacteriota bacterium]|jgi:NADH-quinone oxidoreductase subunit I